MTRLALYVALAAAVIALGLFAYVTDAPAYAGTAAATCANCHVMGSQYENWFHAAHRPAAECVDCHLPHSNVAAYYLEKGRSGLHDVFVFSSGSTPELIRATEDGRRIIQSNCLRCHQQTVADIMSGPQPFDRWCWDCHRTVAHGQPGLALSPYQDSALYPKK
jgi:cytochrome c nitrite reductase small subunit